MTGYVLRRLGWAAVLLLAMSMVTFIIFFVIPTDPARVGRGSTAAVQDIRQATDIQGPIWAEYGQFLWRIVSDGSLGRSVSDRREVNDIIASAAPVTASLIFGGVVMWLLISLPIGVVSALRPRSLLDRSAMIFVLIGVSVHPVWLGLIFAYTFGVKLHWTPISGYCDFLTPVVDCGGPVQWAYHLLLPWLTMATLFAALYVRMIRASVLEALDDDYVRTARAKGARESRVLTSHVLRNAMLPVVTMLGMDIGIAFGGAIFIENVYGLPGVGRLAVLSLARRDLPVIMGIVALSTLAIIIFNLIVDLLYGAIDPRVRQAERDFEGRVGRAERRRSLPGSVGQPA